MTELRETRPEDIGFIASCLRGVGENFAEQCGYGRRFFTYPVTEEQIRRFMDSRCGASKFFTLWVAGGRAGSLELMIDWEKSACTIGRFLIAEDCRSRGYGTEALRLVSEYAFGRLGLGKIRLSVFDFNRSARRCYEKAGFRTVSTAVRDNGWTVFSMEKVPVMGCGRESSLPTVTC